MFEQLCHVVLHLFQLVEMQVRIGNREDVARLRLLINEDALAVALELFFHLENAFAFEHDRENIGGGRITGLVLFDELAQHCLGFFFLDGVNDWRRHFENSLPVRDESGLAARGVSGLFLPARLANVRASQYRRFIEQQRVIGLLVGKRLAARLAGVRAGLDVPLVHVRAILTTNAPDEHEEFSTAIR